MKYNYNSNLGAFVREDGLGKKFWITMVEAQRIMTLYELGNNPAQIGAKIQFKSSKTTISSINTFINNVENGNIVLTTDVPVSVDEFEDISMEARITKLEHDIEYIKNLLEKPCECECECGEELSIKDKVKEWLRS